MSSTHSRSQSRRHETRHAFPVTTTVSKAPGIITDRARSPDENAYKKCRRLPPITLRHPIRLLSTLGQTQLIKVPLKHGDDAGGPGRSHRILSFGCPPLLTAISKLRLGILTEQGEGSSELVPFFRSSLIYFFIYFRMGPAEKSRWRSRGPGAAGGEGRPRGASGTKRGGATS